MHRNSAEAHSVMLRRAAGAGAAAEGVISAIGVLNGAVNKMVTAALWVSPAGVGSLVAASILRACDLGGASCSVPRPSVHAFCAMCALSACAGCPFWARLRLGVRPPSSSLGSEVAGWGAASSALECCGCHPCD